MHGPLRDSCSTIAFTCCGVAEKIIFFCPLDGTVLLLICCLSAWEQFVLLRMWISGIYLVCVSDKLFCNYTVLQ